MRPSTADRLDSDQVAVAGPRSLTAGQFNDDNFLDLATANSGSGDVSVLLGRGDGSFGFSVAQDDISERRYASYRRLLNLMRQLPEQK